ncbi:MAG: hypothetical protein IJU75_02585 [Clostridia bacterium]|nr:hypothetical protein [Clostridia bacterium]
MKKMIVITATIFTAIFVLAACKSAENIANLTSGNPAASDETPDSTSVSSNDETGINEPYVNVPHILDFKNFSELNDFVSLSDKSDDDKGEYLKKIDEMQTGIHGIDDLDRAISKLSYPVYIKIDSDTEKIAGIEYYPEYDYVDITYHGEDESRWNVRIISYMYKPDASFEFEEKSFKIEHLNFTMIKSDRAGYVTFVCTDAEYLIVISATEDMRDWCVNNLSCCASIINFAG